MCIYCEISTDVQLSADLFIVEDVVGFSALIAHPGRLEAVDPPNFFASQAANISGDFNAEKKTCATTKPMCSQ